MRNRSSLFAILMALAVLPPGLAAAQKLDKDDKKWLDDVRPIVLAEEEKTYKGLKEKSDRLEFQLIFWARRDPDLATPENEFQAEYLAGPRDRRPEVPGLRARRLQHRLRPHLHPAGQAGRGAGGSERAAPACSPRRPGPTATGPARRSRAARP